MDGLIELFLFCGVIYYFFNFRANNMVDVLSTRLQVFSNWETRTDVIRNAEQSTPRLSTDGLRRYGQRTQRNRIQNKEQVRRLRENSLFNIKESEPLSIKKSGYAPLLHYCCGSCTPASKDKLVNAISKQYQVNGVNVLLVNSGKGIFSKIFNHLTHVYSFKKYAYPWVTQTVLNDERLREAIEQTACETVSSEGVDEQEAYTRAEERAKSILSKLQSSISDTLLRITAWVLYKVLPCFIQSAVVLTPHIEVVKKANETGLPLVFLPLHRSHLDYIMISFLTLSNNIRNPLIAAGDNLRIPLFGWLMSGLGAFFIKRRIDPVAGRKDVLYRAILHTYIMECLRAGHNIEFFIEGGRTRTGKPCMPKAGILSVIIGAYLDGTIEDALLIPISMNYERLVDGNFVQEQLGEPKKMETFGSALKAIWSTLMGNYGIAKVNFCQPFSLREMTTTFQRQLNKMEGNSSVPKSLKHTSSTSSLYGTDVVLEDHRQLIDSIGRHIVYDCSRSTPIMTTNVVAFILLNKFRDGCTLEKLIQEFDFLVQDLKQAERDLAFCGESIDIVNHALDILGPGLVKQQRQEVMEAVDGRAVSSKVVTAIQPVSMLPNVIELSYYSNTVLVHYVMESAIVTGLYAALQSQINDPKAIAEDNIIIFKDVLVQNSLKVCDILKYEFLFCKPCQDLEEAILHAINNLSYSGVITLKEESYLEEELWSRRYARQHFDDSSDEEHIRKNEASNIQYKINLDKESSRKLEFYHVLLRPLIDTYAFSAFTLKKLVGRSLSEKELVREVLSEIKTNLDRGIANYGESLGVDPIKNSLKIFQKWNVLECHTQENAKIFYLKEGFDEDEAANQIYETVEAFRWKRNID